MPSVRKLEDARKRLAADPTNLVLANALVDTLVAGGDRRGAVEVLSRTGAALQRVGRPRDAIAVYNRVPQIDPRGEITATFLIQHSLKQMLQDIGREDAAAAAAAPPSSPSLPRPGSGPVPAAPAEARRGAETSPRNALAQIPMLKELPSAALDQLSGKVIARTVEPGGVVFLEGTPGTALFFVASGELTLAGHDDTGREITLGSLGAGDVAGEISFLTSVPRTATLLAGRRTQVLELPRGPAELILARFPSLRESLEQLSRRRSLDIALAKSRAFRSLSAAERQLVAPRVSARVATAGERIYAEGSNDNMLYIVNQGEARASTVRAGIEVELMRHRPHEVFGEVAAMSGTPRVSTIIAMKTLELYGMSKSALEEVLERNPDVRSELMEIQMERFVATAQALA